MQKKIIALAVLSTLSTAAFADASVYGIVDAAIASVSGSGQKGDVLAVSGGQSASRIGLKGSEDIGNGLKVVFNLEYGIDAQNSGASTTTSSGIGAARQQLLGLAGSFGTVATGYLQTTGYDWENKFDPLAGSLVSPLQSMNTNNFLIGTNVGAKRTPRALAYISPNISGFTFAVNYSTSFASTNTLVLNNPGNAVLADTATTFKTTAMMASATYEAGPLAAGAVYAKTSNSTANATTNSEYALGGSYDLSVAKLYATYQSNTTNNPTANGIDSAKAYSLSGVIPVGAKGAVGVAYSKNSLTGLGTQAGLDLNGSSYTVGYLENLSSTTNAYVAYSSVKNGADTNAFSVEGNALGGATGITSLTAGGTSSMVAVGLRKKF